MSRLKLATYQSDRGPRAAIIVGDLLHDVADIAGDPDCASVLGLLSAWDRCEPMLRAMLESCATHPGLPLRSVTLRAPVLNPPAIFCIGANYHEHRSRMAAAGIDAGVDPRASGGVPYHFLVASRCCVGPNEQVRAPSKALDWEGELVAVLCRGGREIAVGDALDHVAGYMVGNDLSARDRGFRGDMPQTSVFHHSWFAHKSFDGAAPTGPSLVAAKDLPDPARLRIVTKVNGTTQQDASCADMIFSVAEQIAHLSTILTLAPGDLIFTGTPMGVGAEKGLFLRPGDVVTVGIDGIGAITTTIC